MRVEQYLTESASRFGGKTAVVAGSRRITYAELDAASDSLARALRAQGVARGDRVVLFMDNCAEAVIGIFGVLKAGAAFSPVSSSMKTTKLAYILNNCRATAILTLDRLWPTASQAVALAASVRVALVTGRPSEASGTVLRWDDALALGEQSPRVTDPGIDMDVAMLVYTSGSTGSPKGVVMTHQNVVAAATSITTYLESNADDVILNVLPISFDYGLYQVLMAAKVGATLILEKSFAFPRKVLNRIGEEKVTGLPLVPTMAALIVEAQDLELAAYRSLRYVTNTAAALPPAHIDKLRALFPTARLYSMYGLTECKRCTYLPPDELARRPTSVGIAIPNTEAFVVDAEGRQVPAGAVGELVIRGPHVMQGYWEDPEATDRALRPGFHPWEKVLHTGDLFHTDADGFLYFVGRKDDMIKTRGEKVSPKEVENVLYALPGIREAVVVGFPDPVLGTAIKAVVAVAPGADVSAHAILRHCAANLEDFMVPKIVEFRDALPKTDSGKISRRAVATLEAAE